MIGQIALVCSCGRTNGDRSQTYALQILAIAVAMSALGLGGLFVAARINDRNRSTRRLEARRGD